MFDELKVPTVSVIENMAHFVCNNCDEKHKIFGMGYTDILRKQFGIQNAYDIPIMNKISGCSDKGSPAVLALPDMHPFT